MEIETAKHIEDFYGVYLLCSESDEKKYNGRCYIGYTVNPNRRINQHNKGKDFGGAKKTNNKGPWKMVMIIHGFPNNISALQFEWAWQWPKISSRLKIYDNLKKKLNRESNFNYNFRVLTEMLQTGPWNRLPLTIRWLIPEFKKDFPSDRQPPVHMQISFGQVYIKKKPKQIESELIQKKRDRLLECHLCMKIIENPDRSKINCINPKCILTSHVICLANQCLKIGQYIPIEGNCPICDITFLWGDLIRKKNGCNDLEECENNDELEYEIIDEENDLEFINSNDEIDEEESN